jgi:DNA-binding MarR family transcriptional regulator
MKTPSELSRELGFSIAHVSKTLKELEKMGLVECMAPKLRKGKVYMSTESGDQFKEFCSRGIKAEGTL